MRAIAIRNLANVSTTQRDAQQTQFSFLFSSSSHLCINWIDAFSLNFQLPWFDYWLLAVNLWIVQNQANHLRRRFWFRRLSENNRIKKIKERKRKWICFRRLVFSRSLFDSVKLTQYNISSISCDASCWFLSRSFENIKRVCKTPFIVYFVNEMTYSFRRRLSTNTSNAVHVCMHMIYSVRQRVPCACIIFQMKNLYRCDIEIVYTHIYQSFCLPYTRAVRFICSVRLYLHWFHIFFSSFLF